MKNTTIKKLGFWSIVLYGINSIVGAGIFLSPGEVISGAGKWAPVAYLLAGLFAVLLALVFASASKYVKKNGAAYAYTKAAFGDNASIYVGITRAIAAAIAWGVLATALLQTFFDVFFAGQKMDGILLKFHNIPMGIGLITLVGLLFVINMFGNKVVEYANNISTIGKLTALILFIVSGIAIVFFRQRFNYDTAQAAYSPQPLTLFGFFEVAKGDPAAIIATIFSALYAYTGFESIANAAEEMESPEKNLPRAIPVTMLIVTIIYMSTVVVAMILGASDVSKSTETIKLLAVVLNPTLKAVITFGAFISIFGINIAASFGAPRVLTALSENGILPQTILKKNKQGVPVTAFILTVIIAVAFPFVVQYQLGTLTGISVISRFVQFVVVPLAVIKMASSKSEQWKNIARNAFLDYIVPVVGFILSIILIVVYDYKKIIYISKTTNYNWLSIGLVAMLFIVLPTIGYTYFYKFNKNKTGK